MEHVVKNHLISDKQHGFVPNRNCMTNLLMAVEEWTSMFDDSMAFDLTYTDFSKAFDSVPHARLLKKLEALGIQGNLLKWIQVFLTNRKQRVVVEGKVTY